MCFITSRTFCSYSGHLSSLSSSMPGSKGCKMMITIRDVIIPGIAITYILPFIFHIVLSVDDNSKEIFHDVARAIFIPFPLERFSETGYSIYVV